MRAFFILTYKYEHFIHSIARAISETVNCTISAVKCSVTHESNLQEQEKLVTW
jgi:hypothetical protein